MPAPLESQRAGQGGGSTEHVTPENREPKGGALNGREGDWRLSREGLVFWFQKGGRNIVAKVGKLEQTAQKQTA